MSKGERNESDQVAAEATRRAFDSVAVAGAIVIGEGERERPAGAGRRRVSADRHRGGSARGGLLHAPDCYMEKIIAGPACRGALDLDAPVTENLRTIARCLVLDRPRHEGPDAGDPGRRGAHPLDRRGAGVHAVMGIGGAPEGVLSAAALRCLHGEMAARLVIDSLELEARVQAMGIRDPRRIYTARRARPRRARERKPADHRPLPGARPPAARRA